MSKMTERFVDNAASDRFFGQTVEMIDNRNLLLIRRTSGSAAGPVFGLTVERYQAGRVSMTLNQATTKVASYPYTQNQPGVGVGMDSTIIRISEDRWLVVARAFIETKHPTWPNYLTCNALYAMVVTKTGVGDLTFIACPDYDETNANGPFDNTANTEAIDVDWDLGLVAVSDGAVYIAANVFHDVIGPNVPGFPGLRSDDYHTARIYRLNVSGNSVASGGFLDLSSIDPPFPVRPYSSSTGYGGDYSGAKLVSLAGGPGNVLAFAMRHQFGDAFYGTASADLGGYSLLRTASGLQTGREDYFSLRADNGGWVGYRYDEDLGATIAYLYDAQLSAVAYVPGAGASSTGNPYQDRYSRFFHRVAYDSVSYANLSYGSFEGRLFTFDGTTWNSVGFDNRVGSLGADAWPAPSGNAVTVRSNNYGNDGSLVGNQVHYFRGAATRDGDLKRMTVVSSGNDGKSWPASSQVPTVAAGEDIDGTGSSVNHTYHPTPYGNGFPVVRTREQLILIGVGHKKIYSPTDSNFWKNKPDHGTHAALSIANYNATGAAAPEGHSVVFKRNKPTGLT